MKVNSSGVSFANSQIKSGNYITDGTWSFSGEDGNKLLGKDGNDWANYGKHFLAINPDAEKETKAYYKYPFAKADGVHRKGLIAAKQRAAQQGETDIENAASKLIDMIDNKENAKSTTIYFGDEVKALGDGKVGGYLVRFGDAKNTDLEGDFFTKDTDFDVDFSNPVYSTVYYNHGTDPILGRKKLGGGAKATLKKDEVGIWIEAQLEDRNEYEKAILNLVSQKAMGWSSGTASYLVEREQVGKSFFIKKWTLGIDASLTPTPAEHRNEAISLKSVNLKALNEEPILGEPEEIYNCATYSALCDLVQRFLYMGLWSIIFSDLVPAEEKSAKIGQGADELATAIKNIGEALLSLSSDAQGKEYEVAKSLFFIEPEKQKFKTLQQHIDFVRLQVKNLQNRFDIINEVSGVKSGSVKVGAQFNATNKQFIKEIADKLCDYSKEFTEHGNGLMKMIGMDDEMSDDDMGKSIKSRELEFAERIHEYNETFK